MTDRATISLAILFGITFSIIIATLILFPDTPSDNIYCETGKLKIVGREGWMCITKPLERN